MHWTQDADHPFAGIAEKLKRADQNIFNLHTEILQFFNASKYPVIPDPNSKEWQDAINYHQALKVPKRFSVLSGEVVHHLRSCLDHLVWHFSSPQYRLAHENAIEFPVLREAPTTKDEISRYDRKIAGITNPNVLTLIKDLQPYQRGNDAADDLLCIIHDMDRFDKHRELTIVASGANLTFPPGTSWDVIASVLKYRQGKTLSSTEFAAAQRAVKNDATVRPQVVFPKFTKGVSQFVVPALTQLLNAVDDVAGMFAIEV